MTTKPTYEELQEEINRLRLLIKENISFKNERLVSQRRIKSLWKISGMITKNFNEICDTVLEEIVVMTGSQYGFFGFISHDETEMNIYSWSRSVMKDCSVQSRPLRFSIEKSGIWANAVRERKTVIYNNCNTAIPNKHGYPEGHVVIKRLLCVPVFSNRKIAAIGCVANKNEGYVREDKKQMTAFLNNAQLILAREQMKSLLSEKELLLREVHHRIKNNMSSVRGLLLLQADLLRDSAARDVLQDAGNRVLTMMILYNKLYTSLDTGTVAVTQYLPVLIDEIVQSFPNAGIVQVEKNIEEFMLDAKVCQSLGIIINELITNIMKYAFTGKGKGLITVKAFQKNNTTTIIIQDNGNRLPQWLSFENPTGFGLTLINVLTKQIKGLINIESNKGTKITLTF